MGGSIKHLDCLMRIVANNSVGQQTKVSTQNVTQCLLCFNVLSLCLIKLGRHAASLSCTAA